MLYFTSLILTYLLFLKMALFSQNINNMVNEFYQFIGKTYIDYKSKAPILITVKNKNNNSEINNNLSSNDTVINIEPENTDILKEQSFNDYLMYQLFYNYGIRRKMLNDYLTLMFYDKHHKGYKPNSNITRLCRHMVFDLRYLRIISIGIPRGISLDEFCINKNIDKNDNTTNYLEDGINSKFIIKEFPEGSMIIYNPNLIKHKIEHILANENNMDEEEDLNDKNLELVKKNIDEAFEKSFIYSTRRVIGTSNFTSTKTFMTMFEENNAINGNNINMIPENMTNDIALVFNIEHPENRIINSKIRNRNLLCGVFKFKALEKCIEEFNYLSNATTSDDIMTTIIQLGNNMVEQIPVELYASECANINIKLDIPEIISQFDNISNNSISTLEHIANTSPKYFQGYILYGLDGMRTKITNNKYSELRKLKGNKPIGLMPNNVKNLFYLYWRLVKQNKVSEFLTEFDVGNIYNQSYFCLFNWFSSLINCLSFNLFKTYHNTFVKKLFEKSSIPYHLKPLCGDLHKQYWIDKVPVSKTVVDNYITELPVSKLFWRMFYGLE